MSKSKSKRGSPPKAAPRTSTASLWWKLVISGGLSAGALTVIAIVFAYSPEGKYLVETPAGRAIVEHKIVPDVAPNATPVERTAAAIHISPNAVGAGLTNVRVVGFGQALKDEGKGSRIDQFEAYRSGADLKASQP